MTAAIAAGRRYLPRGYADLLRQMLIWFGFLAAYQVARGVADRDPTRAFANGWKVIDWEQRLAGLGELTLQGWTQSSHFLAELVSWTYWNSEFTVVGLALLWVYLRRNGAFMRFRNTILLANVLGLIGYVLLPTAPPRFFTSIGFIYTVGARSLASRSIVGLARTRVTPNALTTSGVTLCLAAAVIVYFEYRNDLLFYWVGAAVFVIGSILDILDGALARAGGKTTPFGSFLDSTTDRVGEGAMLLA